MEFSTQWSFLEGILENWSFLERPNFQKTPFSLTLSKEPQDYVGPKALLLNCVHAIFWHGRQK